MINSFAEMRTPPPSAAPRRLGAGLAILLGLTGATDVCADSRTGFLTQQLRSEDFRVRTGAALGLGSTDDDAAIPPLCRALADDSATVREAVVAALKRLARPAGVACMKARASSEPDQQVKASLARAIEALEATRSGGGGGEFNPPMVANARYYVAISPVQNGTTRSQGDVDRIVLGAIRSKLMARGKYQLAPSHPNLDADRVTITKRKLRGYYLAVSVEKIEYSSAGMRAKIKCAVFDYPSKSLRGEVPASVSVPGVQSPSPAMEDTAMQAAAERLADLFAESFI